MIIRFTAAGNDWSEFSWHSNMPNNRGDVIYNIREHSVLLWCLLTLKDTHFYSVEVFVQLSP